MNKLMSTLILASLITFIIIVLSAFGLWSLTQPVQPNIVVQPALPAEMGQVEAADLAQMQIIEQRRSTTYEEQIVTLQATIQERSAAYEAQFVVINQQLEQYHAAIAQYQQHIQKLDEQIDDLEQHLKTREASYPANFAQSVQPLLQYRDQLRIQLEETQQALAETNVQLAAAK